jgi:hypothetical protein
MNEQQTAVEWLIEQYNLIGMLTTAQVEKAKAMEKQQMIDFADNYGFDVCGYDYDRAEKYYNETLNK